MIFTILCFTAYWQITENNNRRCLGIKSSGAQMFNVFNATLLVEGERWMNKVVWRPMVEHQDALEYRKEDSLIQRLLGHKRLNLHE